MNGLLSGGEQAHTAMNRQRFAVSLITMLSAMGDRPIQLIGDRP
jgi:hypothetical protein